jgi:DnaJ homologue, subfamily C, member 28, conserved domain
MSPVRRDDEGRRQVGPTYESIVERLIREAMDRGEFDELPYRGEPLPLPDETAAGDMASAYHILRNAGVAPPWIEADKRVRQLLAERDAIVEQAAGASSITRSVLRRRLAALIERANAAVFELNAEAPTPRQQRRMLVVEDELAAFDADGRRDRDAGRIRR